MNEEIDDHAIYHQDFTTVSDWEVFIARLEEVLNDWHLSKSSVSQLPTDYTNKWTVKSEEISYHGLRFSLSYHSLEINSKIISTETVEQKNIDTKVLSSRILNGIWEPNNIFMDETDGSPFPVSTWYGLSKYVMLCPVQNLVDENKIKLIMSSINIAFANVNCGVPFFLKIREHWQQCFLGIYEDEEKITNFDTIHLKRIPSQCAYLNGIMNMFKEKYQSDEVYSLVQVAAQFSYELRDIEEFAWRKSDIDGIMFVEHGDGIKTIQLPFGAIQNPVKNIILNTIWTQLDHNTAVDHSTYTDFDPRLAPMWKVKLNLNNDFDCLLSESINRMLRLFDNDNLLMDVLGLSRSLGLLNPLHKITEPPLTMSKLMKAYTNKAVNSSDFKGPISDEMLMPVLYFIFPDASSNSVFDYPQSVRQEFMQDKLEPKLCSYIKSSPKDGLVWRLSIAALRLFDMGGLPYLAHLWYEFTQELQFRWERHILVPGIAEGEPNARTCLLHQKLQLLNCCIGRILSTKNTAPVQSSDDEFFDASDGEGNADQAPTDRPVGRLKQLDNATLKNGAPLYIPRTQDPAPKTEDQLEEHAELMVRLGDNARASELRARMMSASLLSDMEAFKAANPGAELCDFVQWYSPRDWTPDDGGCLGERMLLPGNPWVETWEVARPVPASKQRRLFDETREAEQVLHFLRSKSVSAVVELLMPGILRAAAYRAFKEGFVSGGPAAAVDNKRLIEIGARDIRDAEILTTKIKLKQGVLGDIEEGSQIPPSNRQRIIKAITNLSPIRREFLLRSQDEHAVPQMMRVALSTDMFIVGAFTEKNVAL